MTSQRHEQQLTAEPKDRTAPDTPRSLDFIRAMVAEDLRTSKYGGRVATRFPPEPNGFLHIGHAKSICLNFGIAEENEGGTCNLRFDDTNPITEEDKYARAIQEDVRWLGYDWEDRLYYASDYFEQFYQYAVQLIEDGKAYVDSSSEEEIREYRGTVTQPGRESRYRNRSVAENLDLLQRMRAGEFADGEHVVRAKIDMASPNMLMRDPLLYRIRHVHHYRTGDQWCIYPMYDFAHCLEDAIERVTHSLCTLEFKDNRALYDWVLQNVGIPNPPEQTEFARLNIDYTVLSKRKLIRLVEEGHVVGWDDPRMPTIAGLRRRGVTPTAIRRFCDMIGVAKVDSRVDMGKLEFSIRDDLNQTSPRVMCVLRPLRVVIENYPEGQVEWLDAPYYPHDVPKEGSREIPFSRELYIERDDFMENPPKEFFRLAPGREVRLRYGYYVKCVDVIEDEDTGEVVELRCNYDPETKGGDSPDGRKVKGTIHWVSAEQSVPAEVRLYDRLFTVPDPEDAPEGQDFTTFLNPESMVTLTGSRIEPSVLQDPPGSRYQFERQGYFCSDIVDSSGERLVYNRTVTLRDTWAKIAEREAGRQPGGKVPKSETTGSNRAKGGTKRIRVGSAERDNRVSRYTKELGLSAGDANVLADNPWVREFFEKTLACYDNATAVAKWVVNDVLRVSKSVKDEDLALSHAHLAALVQMVEDGAITRSVAKEVFSEMAETDTDPREIVQRKGLDKVADGTVLDELVSSVIASQPDEAQRYREGKTALLGFFVGQVMKQSKGKLDPEAVKSLLQAKLSE
ncbi:MAG: glutamine--tRNA ligase/YqeY domain fusion protein [Gemmatimonadota bacterium]|nr:MAG: glutamine--tRNA ligase/YqeY domain fusion protein [Gemmatimonadota bacterium]